MLILIAFFLIKSLRSTKGVRRSVKESPAPQDYPVVPAKPKDDDIKLMAQLLEERLQQEPLLPEESVDK